MRLVRKNVWIGVILLVLLSIGAGPKQSGVPPQAFFADYFSGRVLLDGSPPLPGVHFLACVQSCDVFESEKRVLEDGGMFTLLEINPTDRYLRGDKISFYLANAHGRIAARESEVFEGVYEITNIELNFYGPLPYPPPPASLPNVGDPVLTALPRIAIGFGVILLVVGIALFMVRQRRRAP